MKKASEYRDHAQECRKLAAKMDSEEQRSQLLRIAEHWEMLAADRLALLRNHPELAREGENEENRCWEADRQTDPLPGSLEPGA